MKNDMICQMLQGEVQVKQGDTEFLNKKGHVFKCAKYSHESDQNKCYTLAVMRVIDLLQA